MHSFMFLLTKNDIFSMKKMLFLVSLDMVHVVHVCSSAWDCINHTLLLMYVHNISYTSLVRRKVRIIHTVKSVASPYLHIGN